MLIGRAERRPAWLVDPAADLLQIPHSGPGSDCLAARSQLPSAAGAKASRFGANSADSETDWLASTFLADCQDSTKVKVGRMEQGDRHQQPLQTSDPLAYIDDFNLEPLQLNSQVFQNHRPALGVPLFRSTRNVF